MEVIIEGHKIETTNIWDVSYESDSYGVWIHIKITGGEVISIGRKVPWDCGGMRMEGIKAPYKRLYEQVLEKWNADKSKLEVFKL